jgi:O-antigen/teichoic acid export membrane protein
MIRQFLAFSYGSWVSAAISFLATPVITLLIVPAEFGKAAMFTLCLNFAHQIGLAGMDQSFMRAFYERDALARPPLARQCFAFSLAATLLIACAALLLWEPLTAALFGVPDFGAAALLACCLMLSVVNAYGTAVVRMNKKGSVLSTAQIAGAFIGLLVTIAYARYVAPTFHAVIWGGAFSLAASIMVSVVSERRFWRGRADGVPAVGSGLKELLAYGLPLVPVLAITFVFQAMDKIALRSYSTLDELGLYAVANKFIFMLTLMQTGFWLFWSPVAFEKYETDRENVRFFEKAFEYMAVAVLLAGGALLLLKDVIVLLLARSYADAVYIMPFLIIAPMAGILASVAGVGIRLRKRTHFHIVIALAGALVGFTANSFLTPPLGARGAAISTGIAYMVYFFVLLAISARLFPARCRVLPFAPAFLVLVSFMYVNTFYAVPWWYNVAPAAIAAFLHWRTIVEFLRYGVAEMRARGGQSDA